MFPSPRTGTHWSPDGVSRINKDLLKRAGIDTGVCFHELRHTFATMAIQSGVDMKALSRIRDTTRQELERNMDKAEQKLLLRILDAQSRLKNDVSLERFAAGFKLQQGLRRSLKRMDYTPSMRKCRTYRSRSG